MTAKKGSRQAEGRRKAVKVQDLTDQRGGRAKGGLMMHGDFSTFSAPANNAVQAIGNALQTAAQKG
jgi:hypothetical protein